MNADVTITVLRRLLLDDLVAEYAESAWHPCKRLEEGREFISQGANMPAGFCSWAWADIHKYVMTLARGGNFLGFKPGLFVTCCTDGLRPVVLKLERIQA